MAEVVQGLDANESQSLGRLATRLWELTHIDPPPHGGTVATDADDTLVCRGL